MNELVGAIERARELLRTSNHAAMATVNEDGSPHNTPYFFMYDDALEHLYWGSHPGSQHSKNVTRTGQMFVVLFDARERGGLYIKADHAHVLENEELEMGLKVHNAFRAKQGKTPLPIDYYQGESSQKMYTATPVEFSVNATERDKDGLLIHDYRHPISREDLHA